MAWLQPQMAGRTCNNHPSGFDILYVMHGFHRAKDYPKMEKVSTLKQESDSESGNLET